jgi:hypothetical protein
MLNYMCMSYTHVVKHRPFNETLMEPRSVEVYSIQHYGYKMRDLPSQMATYHQKIRQRASSLELVMKTDR